MMEHIIEMFGRFLLWGVCIYGVFIYYEKYEIPKRLEAARERLIFICEDMAGVQPEADCRHLTPVLMKCE